MRLSTALLLSIYSFLLTVSEGHEHLHAHRHHQFIGRHEHHHEHQHQRRQFGVSLGGASLNIPGLGSLSIGNNNLDTAVTGASSASKSSSTTKSTTSSSRTSSKSTTTTTTTTTTSATSSRVSSKSSSSSSSSVASSASTTKATGTSVLSSTSSTKSSVTSSKTSSSITQAPTGLSNATATTVGSTILVIARDQDSLNQATSGLNGYGIPFQTLVVPSTGTSLPALNSTSGGNFGGIIVASGIVYYYSDSQTYHSALTDDQWNQLYAYQLAYKVRMVQYDVYPQDAYGVSAVGGCCDAGVEQLISLTNTTAFKQAGLRQGASMSTVNMYHYLAKISDTSTTTEIAQYAANSQYSSPSTAGVINNFSGREQMVFFISWATAWSPTSNFLQHAYITWMTRGLYAGFRRVHLNTQIDDVMLRTQIYYPNNSTTYYRLTTNDIDAVKTWTPNIQAKMNPGSWYRVELGHNGNGNIIFVDPNNDVPACGDGPIYVVYTSTSLEFQKTLGTGTDGWPTTPAKYSFTKDCLTKDPLYNWMSLPTNRDWFLHISHTFTHEGQNNATYNDIYKEINWNQQWFSQSGIDGGNFTADGLIPPQITGLHNGDALRAWSDNGLTHCVGDNSRPVLRNQQNSMWPLTTTVANNGFDGITVVPRWAGRTFYNCDTPACTTKEWIDTSGGSGTFTDLMEDEVADATRYLLGLYHDAFMFHQLNLRNQNMTALTTPDGTKVYSLLQNWVENVVQEFVRLVNWPIITLKQSDLANSFRDRQTRDQCGYQMSWSVSSGKITGVTVSSSSNSCAAAIPLTVPDTVIDTKGFATDKVGNDPLTIWVKLTGQPVSFTLSQPIAL